MCAGYDNGDVKMFDLRTMGLRWETNVKNGVSVWSNGSVSGNHNLILQGQALKCLTLLQPHVYYLNACVSVCARACVCVVCVCTCMCTHASHRFVSVK